MRTLDLIRALSDTDIKAIERSLTGGKRENLRQFFKGLKKYAAKSDEPTHKEIYEKLMQARYAKDKDYLLRNKMRQVNELIYEYLTIDAFKKHLGENPTAHDYWLAKAYYDKRLNGLFESDIDDFVSTARATISKNEAIEPSYSGYLYSLKSIWKIHYEMRKPDNIQKQSALLSEWLNEEKKRFLYRIREIEAREAFLKALLGVTANKDSRHMTPPSTPAMVIDLSEQQKGDPFVHYLMMKKKLSENIGWEKVEVLKEMLKAGEKKEYKMVTGPYSKIANTTLLARELILLGEFKSADSHLEKMLAEPGVKQSPQFMSMLQNYIVNQLNLGQYKKGIKIYDHYSNEIKQSNHVWQFKLHMAYFYLFLGKEDDALAHLPPTANLTKQFQIYHRHAYMIAFILRGNYDLAITEAKNLKRFIKRNPEGQFRYYLEIIDLFEEYIVALASDQKTKEKQLQKLNTH
jgi:hypothetical protein